VADSSDVDVNMPGVDVVELRRLLSTSGIRAVYQPIVDLQSLEPVAYEALARGPAGSPLESPERLFATAGASGLLPEVDAACRAAAIDGAVRSTLTDPFTLFVNVEPGSIDGSPLFEVAQQERILRDRVRVVVELTELALTARPADLLAAVAWLRSRGVGVALDDVGVDRRSLALMPFIRPDVIKLDMQLVQGELSTEVAAISGAVGAEAERSGAQVLAEGIETDAHLRRATALGATLGQGWLFGRPDDLPPAPARRAVLKARRPASGRTLGTPFRIVTRNRELHRASKPVLLERSMQLEAQAEELGAEAVLLSTFQEAGSFGDATRERYRRIAARAAFVGAFGAGMLDEPAPGVRGGAIDARDALRDEWSVIVLSPHFAGAFVARDLRDDGPDGSRRFDFAMTYDRDLVTAAASSLMARVVPQLAPAVEFPSWLGAPSLASRA
jgi:EAL domain-containing protein (putative c-di-GMP-specific phosphodiesterase class I)/DICT domain-containing protein